MPVTHDLINAFLPRLALAMIFITIGSELGHTYRTKIGSSSEAEGRELAWSWVEAYCLTGTEFLFGMMGFSRNRER